MPQKIKVEGKEVNEAIEKGLKKLGIRREQAEIKVLEHPRKGFLGLGARPAVVEMRQKRWVSSDLDSQIYMDVPKRKRAGGRNGKGGNRRGSRGGVKEIKRGGRRSYGPRRSAEKVSHENETQLLPSLEIQNAVVPELLKAPMQEAQNYIAQILEHMGIKVENLHTWWDEKQNRILVTLDCDHPAIIIGKEGKTLESLQYLATLSISRHFEKPISVVVDTQNYWRRAEDKINADLEYGINQIKKGYSVYRFRPMSAQLRRYIHRAAENNEFVITVSEGEAEYRKVTLRPRPADQPVAKKEETPAAEVAQAVQETVVAAEVATETPVPQTIAETQPAQVTENK
ncbi:MAG: Jag N-terminal domain-containing protein [Elusimicrobiaceae bacterium]|nr:Jag N-terminal domain-containing protein [Elusimicrobiaceae bacterium]